MTRTALDDEALPSCEATTERRLPKFTKRCPESDHQATRQKQDPSARNPRLVVRTESNRFVAIHELLHREIGQSHRQKNSPKWASMPSDDAVKEAGQWTRTQVG